MRAGVNNDMVWIVCYYQDTQKCKEYLEVLNGKTATLTALTLFVLGSLSLSSKQMLTIVLWVTCNQFVSKDSIVLTIFEFGQTVV